MNVVIIDNDNAFLRSLKILLENIGHQVCSFSNPIEGYNHLLINESVDALLLDYNMPGLSGEELLKKVKGKLSSDCLTILISGHTDIISAQNLFALGVHHLLPKPLNIQVLDQILNSYNKKMNRSGIRISIPVFVFVFMFLTLFKAVSITKLELLIGEPFQSDNTETIASAEPQS
ncbi:response regulator [bacterium]|nr:response regulator [bacterium]